MPGGFTKTFFFSRKLEVNSLGTINGLLYLKFIKFSKIKFIKPLKNPNTSIDLFPKKWCLIKNNLLLSTYNGVNNGNCIIFSITWSYLLTFFFNQLYNKKNFIGEFFNLSILTPSIVSLEGKRIPPFFSTNEIIVTLWPIFTISLAKFNTYICAPPFGPVEVGALRLTNKKFLFLIIQNFLVRFKSFFCSIFPGEIFCPC